MKVAENWDIINKTFALQLKSILSCFGWDQNKIGLEFSKWVDRQLESGDFPN